MFSKTFTTLFMAAAVLASFSAQAATTCPAFEFIYQQKFDYGDGEGFATHSCKETNFKIGDKVHDTVQEAVKSGQAQRAQAELSKALATNQCVTERTCKPDSEMCVRPALQKSFQSVLEQLGKQKAATMEKEARYADAIKTNNQYCMHDESTRIYRARIKAQPLDKNFHQQAVDFATGRADKTLLTELQQTATANTKKLIADENRIFSAGLFAASMFSEALQWVPNTGNNKLITEIMTLADKRGDTLIARDGCLPIEPAIDYYEVAGQTNKIIQAKSRALKFGEQFEKEGSLPAAASCYDAADADAKQNAVSKKVEARREKQEVQNQKSEKVRKEKFTKEQDDLEKELGL